MMGDEIHDSAAPAPPHAMGPGVYHRAVARMRVRCGDVPAVQAPPVRIYIAGPCTGIANENRPAFAAAERALRAVGFEPFNPTTLPGHEMHDQRWLSFMRVDVPVLMQCDAVATLPGWMGSAGALREVHIGNLFDFDVRELADWLAPNARPHRPAALDGPASRRVGSVAHCVRCDTLVAADSEGGEPC